MSSVGSCATVIRQLICDPSARALPDGASVMRAAGSASQPGSQHVELAAWRGRVEAVLDQPAGRLQASQRPPRPDHFEVDAGAVAGDLEFLHNGHCQGMTTDVATDLPRTIYLVELSRCLTGADGAIQRSPGSDFRAYLWRMTGWPSGVAQSARLVSV